MTFGFFFIISRSKFSQRLTVEYFSYTLVRWSYGIVLYEIVTLGKPSYVQSIYLTLKTAMCMRYRSDAIFITIILIKICFNILLGHVYKYIYI